VKLINSQTLSGENNVSDEKDEAFQGAMNSYVGYRYRFGEQNPNLFKAMSSKLLDGVKNESESSPSSDSSCLADNRCL
jgi:hypothetical protein